MKAGRITVSTRKFEVTEVPTPSAGAGQVRIKVGAAGVCLSDVHFLEGILSPGYLTGDEVTVRLKSVPDSACSKVISISSFE